MRDIYVGSQFKICPWKELSCILSGYKWDVAVICSGRDRLPCLCCKDAAWKKWRNGLYLTYFLPCLFHFLFTTDLPVMVSCLGVSTFSVPTVPIGSSCLLTVWPVLLFSQPILTFIHVEPSWYTCTLLLEAIYRCPRRNVPNLGECSLC